MIVNTSLMKEFNLNLLRQSIKEQKKISKPQLAELTGLSVVTVNSLVKILLECGEILEDQALPSSGGRPAAAYRFNELYSLALAVYMHEENGIDTIFISVDNLYGESVAAEKKILSEVTLENIDQIIKTFIEKYPAIKALAFGMPGTEVNGRLFAVDYEGLSGKAFTEYFAKKYQRAALFENDLNAAVTGYCCTNPVSAGDCVIGVYFPEKYPPGAGIFINGQIYRGRDGFAGEITYLPLGFDWACFPTAVDELTDILVKIVLSVVSMYNPHQLVFYGSKLPSAIIEQLPKLCAARIASVLLPNIVLSAGFSADFAVGIRHIALKQLEPVFPLQN